MRQRRVDSPDEPVRSKSSHRGGNRDATDEAFRGHKRCAPGEQWANDSLEAMHGSRQSRALPTMDPCATSRPFTRSAGSALELDTLSSAIERICARVRARNVARRYASHLANRPQAGRLTNSLIGRGPAVRAAATSPGLRTSGRRIRPPRHCRGAQALRGNSSELTSLIQGPSVQEPRDR